MTREIQNTNVTFIISEEVSLLVKALFSVASLLMETISNVRTHFYKSQEPLNLLFLENYIMHLLWGGSHRVTLLLARPWLWFPLWTLAVKFLSSWWTWRSCSRRCIPVRSRTWRGQPSMPPRQKFRTAGSNWIRLRRTRGTQSWGSTTMKPRLCAACRCPLGRRLGLRHENKEFSNPTEHEIL